jgi:NitT/TauT family transport system permease protein
MSEFDVAKSDASSPPLRSQVSTRRRATDMLISATSLVVFLVIWEVSIRAGDVSSYIFPAPSKVLVALWRYAQSPDYLYAVAVTLFEVLVGFVGGALLGLGVGVGLALSPLAEKIFYPYVVGFQSIPKVAIAPLMVVWFGFGISSKLLIVAFTAMFPVLVNTIAGMRSIDADRLFLMRGLCASRMQMLRYLLVPNALPYLFAGLNTAIVFSVIGAIVGEFVGARDGLGVAILKANFELDMSGVFASLLVLAAAGVLLNKGVHAIERRACFWSGSK